MKQKNNTSGIFGVYFSKDRNKWVALNPNKKNKPKQKRFSNKEDAINQRKIWEQEYLNAKSKEESENK